MEQNEHKRAGASRHGRTKEEQRETHVGHDHRLTKSGGEERRRRRVCGRWRKSHKRPHIPGKQRSSRERGRARRGEGKSGREDKVHSGRTSEEREQRAEARAKKEQCPSTKRACRTAGQECRSTQENRNQNHLVDQERTRAHRRTMKRKLPYASSTRAKADRGLRRRRSRLCFAQHDPCEAIRSRGQISW